MHNFMYLAQRRSQEFSCEPNLGGRAPRAPWLRHWCNFTVLCVVVCSSLLIGSHTLPDKCYHQHTALMTGSD